MAKKKGAGKRNEPEKRYTYKGKFVSKEFVEVIGGVVLESGKDLQAVLDDKNLHPYIDKLIDNFAITWYRTARNVATVATNYDKDIVYFSDGGELTKATLSEAMLYLASLEAQIYEKKDIIFIKYKTELTLDGKLIIYAPVLEKKRPVEEDEEELTDDEIIDDYLEGDDVMYMDYDEDSPGGKNFHNPTE